MSSKYDFSKEREEMVSSQLKTRGINDESLLRAFRKVPRHIFIPPERRQEDPYGDHPVSIGSGQTISQPYMVASMTQLLNLKDTDRVLEIGTGSGYQTAILAELAKEVYTIERIGSLSRQAESCLADIGYDNIYFKVGDGSLGWKEYSPYDAIIVTCAAPLVPDTLKEQVAQDGRIAAPIGNETSQILTIVEKKEGSFTESKIFGCIFVPLVGRYGFKRIG
jgi:protein-L-isoaspartate(D-aspartate) O-methyltransferase